MTATYISHMAHLAIVPTELSSVTLFVQHPEDCRVCSRIFFETELPNGSTFRTCVKECPIGTYLDVQLPGCLPCYEHCSIDAGCAGPLFYLDLQNGCLNCSLVQLNQMGEQVCHLIIS